MCVNCSQRKVYSFRYLRGKVSGLMLKLFHDDGNIKIKSKFHLRSHYMNSLKMCFLKF